MTNLVDVLNTLYNDTTPVALPRKSGRQQLEDNTASILAGAVAGDTRPTLFGYRPCLVTSLSLDGRGRAQRAMRALGHKYNFRPWHITWIVGQRSVAPLNLEYSHRCHNENCVESTHGLWETDGQNKSRWSCRTCSHVILPDDRVVVLCSHEPCCLRPLRIATWEDPRIVMLNTLQQ